MNNKKKIYFLVGPTCSGKSKIATLLCQKYSFEIISLDSSTIYKGLNIGTDKPNSEILKKHPHHLVNIIEPNESYDVNKFYSETRRLLSEITSKGRTPILVGGTMMYFDRLLSGINSLPSKSEGERDFIQFLLESYSLSDIHQTLKIIDIDSFDRISKNDKQRIERALEVYLLTGRPMSSFFGTKASLFEHFECQIVYLLPKERNNSNHVYHLFVIQTRKRDKLIEYLKKRNIITGIHYPVPVHLQNAYKDRIKCHPNMHTTESISDKIISLPIYPELDEKSLDIVVTSIKDFFKA